MNDIVVNKIQSIQRCILRAREELALAGAGFAEDHSRQDAAVLNVTRACEQAIDLANHVVRVRRLGIPVSSADAFDLLARAGIVPRDLAERLRRMIGFRNVAVHAYQELDLAIVEAVIRTGLDDLVALGDAVLALEPPI